MTSEDVDIGQWYDRSVENRIVMASSIVKTFVSGAMIVIVN